MWLSAYAYVKVWTSPKLPVVSQRTAKKCAKSYNARAQLLFCSLNYTDGPLFGDPQNVLHNEDHAKFLNLTPIFYTLLSFTQLDWLFNYPE